MFGILGSLDVSSGPTYPTFDDLFKDLKANMQKDGYKVVKSRTHRNKVGGNYEKGGEVVRCDLVCDRGGQPYKCTATQLKTSTKKTNCPWRAKAVNRKTLGAWVLTVICDQHNHEPRTPEPLTDEEDADADGDAEIVQVEETTIIEPEVPTLDADTSAVLAVAGVSQSSMRLTGETFHQFKGEYRRMPKPDRIATLAQMQLRIAAIYAVENEDMQRNERQARQERKQQQELEDNNRRRVVEQQQQQQQNQHPQHHHQQHHQQHHLAQFIPMGAGAPKHPFSQTPEEEQAQAQERRRHLTQIAREHLGTPNQPSPMQQTQMQQTAIQQTPITQTPVPVPQFAMQSAPANQNIFRHYTGTPQQAASSVPTPVTAPPRKRGRPPKNTSKG